MDDASGGGAAAAAGAADAAGSSRSVTGTLTSGRPPGPRRRGRTVALALAGAALLAGGFLAQGLGGSSDRAAEARPSPGAPPSGSGITGPRGLQFESASGTATLVLGSVTRVPGPSAGTALELDLRLAVLSGAQLITPGTFTTADPDGGPPIRAGGVTVIEPGAAVVREAAGFRISSPTSVEVRVVLDVPPGRHVVSVLGESTGQVLGTFTVRG